MNICMVLTLIHSIDVPASSSEWHCPVITLKTSRGPCGRTWNMLDLPSAKSPNVQQRGRKSTRLNSSHQIISYAVFCLKKKISKHKSNHSHDINTRFRNLSATIYALW